MIWIESPLRNQYRTKGKPSGSSGRVTHVLFFPVPGEISELQKLMKPSFLEGLLGRRLNFSED